MNGRIIAALIISAIMLSACGKSTVPSPQELSENHLYEEAAEIGVNAGETESANEQENINQSESANEQESISQSDVADGQEKADTTESNETPETENEPEPERISVIPAYGEEELQNAERSVMETGDEESFLEMLSVSLPYKGMDEKYIDKTWLGAPNYGPVYDSLKEYSYMWCIGDKEVVYWADIKNENGGAKVTLAHSRGVEMWQSANSGPLFDKEDIRSASVPETPAKEESIEHYEEIMKYDSAEEYADHMYERVAEDDLLYNDMAGDYEGYEEEAYGDAWNDCYKEWMRNRG